VTDDRTTASDFNFKDVRDRLMREAGLNSKEVATNIVVEVSLGAVGPKEVAVQN
jgi:hypothetical protein